MTTANTPSAAPTLRRRTGPNILVLLLRSRMAGPSLVVVAAVILCALFANVISPYDPYRQDYKAVMQPPSRAHLMGTDDIGRDVLSRIIWGARISMSVGFISVGLALLIGVVLGALAGFYGGWLDRITGRVTDLLMAFPALLLGIMIAAALGPGFGNLVGAVAVAFLPRFIRVARASTLSVRREPYVEASFAAGQRPWRIVLKHVLPNIAGPVVVVATLWIATAIRIEATLSFIGLGVQPPAPSWGNIIRDGLTNLMGSPWPVITAGLALTLCVLAFNIVGDALRDAIDPDYRE